LRGIGCPHGTHGGKHAGTRGDAVVDEDHCVARDVDRSTPTAVGALPPMKLLGLAVDRGLQLLVADAETAHQVVVDHHAATRSDGAHREFLPLRHTELAHQENVQRRVQERCDFPADGHTATG
jgi:hypothetical protein